ncbi:CHAT domain-containing protein [Bradyrhizobium liaoningense]|uniref:CHAT domain-containing protein n=1 Tax=Bradyrhizobium liaoningense TaxID=43992 RepID=UPI001BAA8124|nr:CHAT domain-containing protein [Bradyrhizobium liaoningense]MBR0817700.1 CHAT domain-containing protein [Bradyrhizobium liaoningense]
MSAKKVAPSRAKAGSRKAGKPAKARARKRTTTAKGTDTVRDSSSPPAVEKRSDEYEVRIRYSGNKGLDELVIPIDDQKFYPSVQRWRYVIANRRRIVRSTRDDLSRDLQKLIKDNARIYDESEILARIKEMAAAKLVEVRIPYNEENVGWSARLFPWESALWLATAPYRSEPSEFAVVRHLAVQSPYNHQLAPATALAVDSGPGKLRSLYEFAREIEMVKSALKEIQTEPLPDPDRQELRAKIVSLSPAIVHLAGVDPMSLVEQKLIDQPTSEEDGFVLRASPSSGGNAQGNTQAYDAVGSVDLADIVTAGAPKPLLVAISSCYSAQRLAPLATAQGARHAIGFVDTITDADAMLFFSVFYRTLAQDWNVKDAFLRARQQWMSQAGSDNEQRSGVALWSQVSLLDSPQAGTIAARPAATKKAARGGATYRDLKLDITLVQDKSIPGRVRKTSSASLNYSLLHNDRPPFSIFTVHKTKAGPVDLLQVEIVLEVGTESCRCRFSEELPEEDATLDLLDKIRLPLVAGMLRQTSESLRSNLYIKVQCGKQILRESSERVTVLPADEWRDDGEDHRWLPSFVLPRDPTVLKVVACAQRYLQTLLDDCSAGFDGYQQVIEDDSNAPNVVDPQVQAIWAALQHDLPVNYINPPPSYTSQSQRLRTPTEIFKGSAATCIDLALLFASCLEFVGIYSSVFLITGHAFPAYWRSNKAWWRMKSFRFDQNEQQMPGQVGRSQDGFTSTVQSTNTKGQTESWMFTGTDNLAELLSYVQKGELVPFESTFVTARKGFFQALERGASNLHPQSFDAMIDIQSARGESVTPLPLLDRLG